MNVNLTRRPSIFMIIAAVSAVSVAACGSSNDSSPSATTVQLTTTTAEAATTQEATTTTDSPPATVDQLAVDKALIKQLWRDFSDSWSAGVDAGIAFIREHDYPGYLQSSDTFTSCHIVDFEAIVDQDSIEPDPGWTIAGGGVAGQVAEGTTYIMTIDMTYTFSDGTTDEQRAEVHVVVSDDEALFFISTC